MRLAGSTCLGWISVLPSKPMSRPWSQIVSNASASSPSQLVSEADSLRLLENGPVPKSTVPKTPAIVKGALRDATSVDDETFVEGVKQGFKNTEVSLADVYSEVALVSSRLGLPSDPSTSHGSCYGDLEALKLYVSTQDSSISGVQGTLQAHHTALEQCDKNFVTYGQSIDQAVASSLAAAIS